MIKTVYIISGLDADETVFQKLDLSAYNVTYIKWVNPTKNESIESYASRLIAQVTIENPILIGVSFGGMIAVEMSKQIKTEKLILISTVITNSEVPKLYRIFGVLRLNKIAPASLFKICNIFTYWLFGVKSLEDKNILKTMIKNTDSIFLKWAINSIFNWQNTFIPSNICRIHGDKDRILPMQKNTDFIIKGVGHLAVLTHAANINSILKSFL